MELFSNLSDDQLALLGCFGAIFASMVIMSLSYYIGPGSQASQQITRTLPHVERLKTNNQDEHRKAA